MSTIPPPAPLDDVPRPSAHYRPMWSTLAVIAVAGVLAIAVIVGLTSLALSAFHDILDS